MPRMTVVGRPAFQERVMAETNRHRLAGTLGVSLSTVEKLRQGDRGVGVNTIAGALTAWAPLRFEDLFAVVPAEPPAAPRRR